MAKTIIKYFIIVAIVAVASIAANVFIIKAASAYVVDNVLNECGACGARTLDRYPEKADNGDWVYVCPLCAQDAR